MRRLLVGFVVLLSACSSGNNVPKNILPRDTMAAVLWDEMKADAYTKNFLSKDSTLNLPVVNTDLQRQIFTRHKIDRTVFFRSYDYYVAHPDLLRETLDSMVLIQTRLREKEQQQELKKLE